MIEVCSIAGWVCDLMGQLSIAVQVANTSDDFWRWRKVKQKDDRREALKAARYQVSTKNQTFVPIYSARLKSGYSVLS